VHFLRDMLGQGTKAQQPLVATAIRQIFAAEDADEARERPTGVTAALEQSAPKVARLLAGAEDDLLAFMSFPAEHWTKLRSTNPLERVNREIGRRSDVVGIYPNDAALVRLAGRPAHRAERAARGPPLPLAGVARGGARPGGGRRDRGGGKRAAGGLRPSSSLRRTYTVRDLTVAVVSPLTRLITTAALRFAVQRCTSSGTSVMNATPSVLMMSTY